MNIEQFTIEQYTTGILALFPNDTTVQELRDSRRLNDAEVAALHSDVAKARELGRELGTTLNETCPQNWRTALVPASYESLYSWFHDIASMSTCQDIRLIAGDSRGHYRVRKGPPTEEPNTFAVASPSDGMFAIHSIANLIWRINLQKQINLYPHLDEWPETSTVLKNNHVIIVGTGEVNICALFLHGLACGLYFGNSKWPPTKSTFRDTLQIETKSFSRFMDSKERHYGAVVMLKSPWNPSRQLLWIAGLSGIATAEGCRLVESRWKDYEQEAMSSTGVVYETVVNGAKGHSRPVSWLARATTDYSGKKPVRPVWSNIVGS